MPSSIGRRAALLAAVVTVGVTTACGAGAPPADPPSSSSAPPATAAAPQQLQPSTLVVPDAFKGEFDPHQVLIPAGWSMSVSGAVIRSPQARQSTSGA